jgi:hypothetical protein
LNSAARTHNFPRGVPFCLALLLSAAAAASAAAQTTWSAWAPSPGHGYVQLGASRKTASTSWDTGGDVYQNTTKQNGKTVISYHDFRYGYLSGEVGVLKNLSASFLFTYLYGLEGPHGSAIRNVGFSDTWLGLKYQVHHGDYPMAVAFSYRTPFLYDLPGPYSRYLYDSNGNIRANSPEWRGLLKHDYTFAYVASHSYDNGRGWLNFNVGYTFRQGAPADQIPVWLQGAYPLPFLGAAIQGDVLYVRSLGNDSPAQDDDRFKASPTNNFNNASIVRGGISIFVPFGHKKDYWLSVGYNQWLWGRSARRYREPYLSVGRKF